MTPEENQDYFKTLQLIHQFIEWEFRSDSSNIAIQNGPEAGQTVPHLHTHIIPRYKFNNIGDKIYENLDQWTFDDQLKDWKKRRELYLEGNNIESNKQLSKPDNQRFERSLEVMTHEATKLREKLLVFLKQNPHLN